MEDESCFASESGDARPSDCLIKHSFSCVELNDSSVLDCMDMEAVLNTMKPFGTCPCCGAVLENIVSFKGRKGYRNKRKTQRCKCGWSCVIPTEREAMVQLGLLNEQANQE